MTTAITNNGEVVTVLDEERWTEYGDQVRVIYADRSGGWEYVSNLEYHTNS